MNNFQNNTSLNLFLPQSKTSTEFDQTRFDTEKKKRKENKAREKLENRKPAGALKILFESENLSRKEIEPEWDTSQTRRKKSFLNSLRREDAEEQVHVSGEGRKKKKSEKGKTKYRKPNWVSFLESEKYQTQEVEPQKVRNPEIWNFKQVLKARGSRGGLGKSSSPLSAFGGQDKWKNQTTIFQENFNHSGRDGGETDENLDKQVRKAQKSLEKFGEKSSKVSFTSQITMRKESKTEKIQAREGSPHSQTGTVSLCLWNQKSSPGMAKVIQISQNLETKPWDSRKTQINEILKGHAQKVQGNSTRSCQNIKDYTIQEMTELLLKANIPSNSNSLKKLEVEVNASEKADEVKSVMSEISKKSEEEEEGDADAEDAEEKKKKLNKWITFPQSNELERRLNGAWFEQGSLFPQAKSDGEEKSEEKSVKGKDEKKEEKRMTYTDRLLLSKMSKKEVEKPGSSEKTSESSKTINESSEADKEEHEDKKQFLTNKKESWTFNRPPDPTSAVMALSLTSQVKKMNLTDNREMVAIKDTRYSEVDTELKARSARSNELRDLVTQAVREHKIFCIFDNHWYIVRPVREELLNRGWLEVIPDRRLIPKRRPPPSGPAYDREKNAIDRNYSIYV